MKRDYCKKSLYAALIVTLVIASGCATHGKNMEPAFNAMSRGDYSTTLAEVEKNLGKKNKERLVYNMEMGLVRHLDGQYNMSNDNLQAAADVAEDLETKRASDLMMATLSNPRSGPYCGTKYEKVLIHYYKVLNYLKLASKNPEKKSGYIQSARVEARQIDIKLTALQKEIGTYQESKDKKKTLVGKLKKIFDALDGKMDKDKLIYREDAFIRYVAGLVYEKNGELDEARVSYQNAATLYEKGYAKQYELGSNMTELAWFDTIRVMRDSGDWQNEWKKLAKEKLSASMQKKLKEFKKGTGQLVVIQGTGRVPARDEMSFQLKLDKYGKALVLSPYVRGRPLQERKDIWAWFSSMYSDTSVLSVISNYRSRGVGGAIEGIVTKRISLGLTWGLVEAIDLPETMEVMGPIGFRVTVPYYRPFSPNFLDTNVYIDENQVGGLAEAQSVAQLALYEQFLNADSDLKEAVIREVVKNSTTAKVGKAVGGDLLAFVGGLANMATSAAETRNWLTLPYSIRIQRFALPPGKHNVRLVTGSRFSGVPFNETSREVEIKNGNITVLSSRAIGK